MGIPFPVREDEAARVENLADYEIFESEREEEYDAQCQLAAHICGTQSSYISFLSDKKQFFKSTWRLPEGPPTIPRRYALCNYTICDTDVFIIDDLTADERFKDTMVGKRTGVRFYAGMRIDSEEGFPIGSLCILDAQPKHLNEEQKNALRLLARQVAQLVILRRANRLLREAHENMKRHLSIGAMVQSRFLPEVPKGTGWNISVKFLPSATISGDFYDFLSRPEEALTAAAVFDISGHGISAGLLTIPARSLIHRHLNRSRNLKEFAERLHGEFQREFGSSGLFITGQFLKINGDEVTFVSPGHLGPLLRKADGTVMLTDASGGTPLGLSGSEVVCEEISLTLAPGDALLLYSDGIIEAEKKGEREGAMEQFGIENLISAWKGSEDINTPATLEHIVEAARNFCGSFSDDVTLVLLERTG